MITVAEETHVLELVETTDPQPAPSRVPALAENTPMAMMLQAQRQGASLADIRAMMEINREIEADAARRQFNAAFAAFTAEAVKIVRNRKVNDGPLKGKSYAELKAFTDALTPALAKHGLSTSWKLTKDDKDWMEVTCFLRHAGGHVETASMGGPPDTGGAKNAIQARGSTKTYLERYTLKAVCGVAEGDEDDDGNGGGQQEDQRYDAAATLTKWTAEANAATELPALAEIRKRAGIDFNGAKDLAGWNAFKQVVDARRVHLQKGGAQ